MLAYLVGTDVKIKFNQTICELHKLNIDGTNGNARKANSSEAIAEDMSESKL